ncbi:CopG family antitoxin [Methylocapsa sp. S129]|uniref:CopG family antitoxin n=1 Tax=Methylocapsa sp. S129 TaxID=1641869 RepID=UPI00131DF78C|nr:BrnA antitoxin family protein [Methylocapsa sp. S129]
MSKTIPIFKTDEEAETFIDTADLSEYDLSGFKPAGFEFEAKDAQINMRLPESLLRAVRETAKERGIPYQRFIRQTLEHAVARKRQAT